MLILCNFFQQIFTDVFVYYLLYHGHMNMTKIPDAKTFALRLVGGLLTADCMLYWYHRTVHTYPSLYKTLHKPHHEFNVASVYASFHGGEIEGFCQTAPNWIVTRLFNFSFAEYLALHAFAELMNIHERLYQYHIGYSFPYDPLNVWPFLSSDFHDWHHSHNAGAYSLTYFRFWDALFGGTDAKFNEWTKRKNEAVRSGAKWDDDVLANATDAPWIMNGEPN
ncbi:hypothetical protein HDU93_001170 [Gonapodya sp. JEL0774]|nr:hypothetical protein HDU93_001170 [Gonapodya sp. JEL0774]